MFAAILFAIAFLPMLAEARRAARNERLLRAAGASEPPHDVYPLMRVAYPACFLAMIVEGWLRGAAPGALAAVGVVVFAGAKALKYWAVAVLGPRWTFRVLVPADAPLVDAGPYRVLRHPNYVAVIGELGGMALLSDARVSGPVAVAMFALIIAARVRVEEQALGLDRRSAE
jgi:methyltransferase